MKKVFYSLFLFLIMTSYSSALTCTDLQKDLSKVSKGKEVTSLQKFLYEKGFLKSAPDGVYGNTTIEAVKEYQKSAKLTANGNVFSITRQAIRKETCKEEVITRKSTKEIEGNTTMVRSAGNSLMKTSSVGSPPKKTTMNTVQMKPNSLMSAFPPMSSSSNPVTMNTFPQMSSSSRPNMMNTLLAPSASTTSTATTTMPMASSSFIGMNMLPPSTGLMSSSSSQATSTSTRKEFDNLGIPKITSIDKATLIRGGSMKVPLVLRGSNFSALSNKVILTARNTGRNYFIGYYQSITGTSTQVSGDFTLKKFSCGLDCEDYLPVGDYDISIKTSEGESNSFPISIKSISSSVVSGSNNISVKQQQKGALIGTVTFSSGVSLASEKVNLMISGSLSSKITNIKVKDELSKKIVSGSNSFNMNHDPIPENQSKIYGIYADINAPVSGYLYIDPVIIVKDYYGGNEIEMKLPTIMVTVSG